MTNKSKAIKEAVFYAHEDPEKLAELIAPLITDKASGVSIDGPTTITLDTTEGSEVEYTGSVLSQFGDKMSGTVTYSLESSVEGVSISSNTVTVAKTVSDGTQYTVVATANSKTAKITTTVEVAE